MEVFLILSKGDLIFNSICVAIWKQMSSMKGDYFAQNSDVVQPGSLAPWSVILLIIFNILCFSFIHNIGFTGILDMVIH